MAQLLKPDDEDYFVLKPKQSAFFGTTLDTLLRSLGTTTVILTGIAGDNCVLFSANDAYMRDLKLFIPSDCVASNTEDENHYALKLMQKVVKADIRPSTDLDLEGTALTQHLVQLLLPIHLPDGSAVPPEAFARVRVELTERFGGVTAYSRSPATGLWKPSRDGDRTRPGDHDRSGRRRLRSRLVGAVSRATRTAFRPGGSACPRHRHRAHLIRSACGG